MNHSLIYQYNNSKLIIDIINKGENLQMLMETEKKCPSKIQNCDHVNQKIGLPMKKIPQNK